MGLGLGGKGAAGEPRRETGVAGSRCGCGEMKSDGEERDRDDERGVRAGSGLWLVGTIVVMRTAVCLVCVWMLAGSLIAIALWLGCQVWLPARGGALRKGG